MKANTSETTPRPRRLCCVPCHPPRGYTLLLSSYVLFCNVTLAVKKKKKFTWILSVGWEKAMLWKRRGGGKRKIGFQLKALLVLCKSVNHCWNEIFKPQQHNTSVPRVSGEGNVLFILWKHNFFDNLVFLCCIKYDFYVFYLVSGYLAYCTVLWHFTWNEHVIWRIVSPLNKEVNENMCSKCSSWFPEVFLFCFVLFFEGLTTDWGELWNLKLFTSWCPFFVWDVYPTICFMKLACLSNSLKVFMYP